MLDEDIIEVWEMTGNTDKKLSEQLGVSAGRIRTVIRNYCANKALSSDKHMIEIELSRTRIKLHGYRIELDELEVDMTKEDRNPFSIARRVEVIELIRSLEEELQVKRNSLRI